MQRVRHGFISGKHDVSEAREGGREVLSLSAVHRFDNFMVYYFELFGTLKLYIVNRSIVHAIRLHVSEVRAPARLALTLYVCRARVQLNRVWYTSYNQARAC